MLKLCKYCGQEYRGDPGSSACPDCVAARKKTTVADHICRTCGITFKGGPASLYCSSCAAERRKKQASEYRARKRAGNVREIGSTDICVICGREYTVDGGKQRYCKDCAAEAIRLKDIEASKKWNALHTTPEERKKVRKAAVLPIQCVICGQSFIPSDSSITCTPECSAKLRKQRFAEFEKRNRSERNEYQRKRTAAKIAAMSETELSEYRKKVNARSRENYRKRKEKNQTER